MLRDTNPKDQMIVVGKFVNSRIPDQGLVWKWWLFSVTLHLGTRSFTTSWDLGRRLRKRRKAVIPCEILQSIS
jgi:hypothetical protein